MVMLQKWLLLMEVANLKEGEWLLLRWPEEE